MLTFAIAAVLAAEVTRYSAFEELESSGDVVGAVLDDRHAIVGLAGRFPINCDPTDERSLTDGVIRF